MLAEGFLDMPPLDVEAGTGIQPLVTPSGMGIEMLWATPAYMLPSIKSASSFHLRFAEIQSIFYV